MNSNYQTQRSSAESEMQQGNIDQHIEKLDAANSVAAIFTKIFDKLFRRQGFINRTISSSLGILYKTVNDHGKILRKNDEEFFNLTEQNKAHLARTEKIEHNILRIEELERSVNATFSVLKIIDKNAKEGARRILKLEELYYRQIETTSSSHENSLRSLQSSINDTIQKIEDLDTQHSEKHKGNHKQILELKSFFEKIDTSQKILQGELQNHALNLQSSNPIIEKLHRDSQLKLDRETTFREYFDPFYSSFEEKYRGSRKIIINRLKGYESHILEAATNFKTTHGNSDAPIAIDLGCGRGEWLEVVGGYGIPSLGVDTNNHFIKECMKVGHNVVLGDAVNELSKINDESVAIITAFHLVEHLEFDYLLKMFNESYRALVPGGILIFETPNPENLLVSTQSFYLDPTHKNPIPPALLEFCSSYSGFQQVDRKPSSPFSKDDHIPENTHASNKLNELLYGPQDYAIIARK